MSAMSKVGLNRVHLAPLSQRGWVSFRGADALSFLHSQLSADVLGLPEHGWRAAAYCTPQGRVSAVLRVMFGGDGLYAELPAELAEGTIERLKLFVLRSRVEIEYLTGHSAFGCYGAGLGALLERLGYPMPEHIMGHARRGDIHIMRIPGPQPRCVVHGPRGAVLAIWDQCVRHADPSCADQWRLQEIESAWPDVHRETRNQFLPQSLNLEAWGGLSYSKGCYPGQEIIARTRYRGRLKQHLFRATVAAQPPAPGTSVLRANGQSAGAVLYGAASNSGQSRLLAVLRDAEDGAYRIAGGDGMELTDLENLGNL